MAETTTTPCGAAALCPLSWATGGLRQVHRMSHVGVRPQIVGMDSMLVSVCIAHGDGEAVDPLYGEIDRPLACAARPGVRVDPRSAFKFLDSSPVLGLGSHLRLPLSDRKQEQTHCLPDGREKQVSARASLGENED